MVSFTTSRHAVVDSMAGRIHHPELPFVDNIFSGRNMHRLAVVGPIFKYSQYTRAVVAAFFRICCIGGEKHLMHTFLTIFI